MSQRFGGRYSPGPSGTAPARMARPHPVGARVRILFVLPFAFALRGFFQDATGLALNLGAFGVLMLAAWLTREGVLAQAAYEAREVARRPAIPRKIFASVLTGLGLAVVALPDSILSAGIFAVLGAALHFASFGPDPLKDKGMEGVDSFQTDRAAQAVAQAEKYLIEMQDAIRRSGDRNLLRRVEAFADTIRPLFRAVENDPRQLSSARRYLGLYLMGARDATIKFADLYAKGADSTVREDYEALLEDLETRFTLRREALLEGKRVDLDIEIEVLRERLEREGLRPQN